MIQSILKSLFESFRVMFLTAEAYEKKIRTELAPSGQDQPVEIHELLTLVRDTNPGTWNVTSIHAHVVPHLMKLHTRTGKTVTVWGFLQKDHQVKSFISAPGIFLEFEAGSGGFSFTRDGRVIVHGGNIFGKSFLCLPQGDMLQVVPPNRRPDWNSSWHRPSFVHFKNREQTFCRLYLHPFRDTERVVEESSEGFRQLEPAVALAILSLSVIMNCRFVS